MKTRLFFWNEYAYTFMFFTALRGYFKITLLGVFLISYSFQKVVSMIEQVSNDQMKVAIFCKVLACNTYFINFGLICCLFETVPTYSGIKILTVTYESLALFLSATRRILAKNKGKVNHLSENTFILCFGRRQWTRSWVTFLKPSRESQSNTCQKVRDHI